LKTTGAERNYGCVRRRNPMDFSYQICVGEGLHFQSALFCFWRSFWIQPQTTKWKLWLLLSQIFWLVCLFFYVHWKLLEAC